MFRDRWSCKYKRGLFDRQGSHSEYHTPGLVLNQDSKDRWELIDIVHKAMEYFPDKLWDGIKYIGNIDTSHNIKIKINQELRGAFDVNELVKQIRVLRKLLEINNLLLALTLDPVVLSYYRYGADKFSRILSLVKDFVASDIGLISLFDTDEETAIRISAHGLGHSKGLIHHSKPLDLMYVGLLDGSPLRNNRFFMVENVDFFMSIILQISLSE